jgi:phosphoenolpyruvate carboxykinase (ATP)
LRGSLLTHHSLKYTRAILDAIHSGELAKVEYETYDTFNLAVPKTCSGVPSELLNPQNAWTQGATRASRQEVTKLGVLFNENFKKYSSEATEEVIKAGPEIKAVPEVKAGAETKTEPHINGTSEIKA